MTAYNEDVNQLAMTLDGIKDNLKEFKKLRISLEDVLVVVIFDGCLKINETIKKTFIDMD